MANEGYAAAFYELAKMMGVPAQPLSPQLVWEQQMKPRLAALLAAEPASAAANEPMIPAGMKPWHGGDAAPADFYYDRVLFSDGKIGSISRSSDLWSRFPVSGEPYVVAYTPRTAHFLRTPTEPESGAADERVRVLREALEPFANAAMMIGNPHCTDDLPLPAYAYGLIVGDLRRARAALQETNDGE